MMIWAKEKIVFIHEWSLNGAITIKPIGKQSAQMINVAKFIVYEGAQHGLWYTEREKLNQDLVSFI